MGFHCMEVEGQRESGESAIKHSHVKKKTKEEKCDWHVLDMLCTLRLFMYISFDLHNNLMIQGQLLSPFGHEK